MSCPCSTYQHSPTGGLKASGSSTVIDSIVRGGVNCSGTALVDVPTQTFDGYLAVWGLTEEGMGVEGEYEDYSGHQKTGTGGGGNSNYCPDLDSGLLCLTSQDFERRDFITFEDPQIEGTFTISVWVKSSTRFQTRNLYTSDSVVLRRNFLGMPELQLTFADLSTVTATGGLQERRSEGWTHFAATYDLTTVKLYVNGAKVVEKAVTGGLLLNSDLVTLGRGFEGNLQELRITPEVRTSDWLLTEYQAICGTLLTLGEEEEGILG